MNRKPKLHKMKSKEKSKLHLSYNFSNFFFVNQNETDHANSNIGKQFKYLFKHDKTI